MEEFADNVNAMQTLALKVRYVELLDTGYPKAKEKPRSGRGSIIWSSKKWEEYLVEIGIGRAGINAS